MKTLIVAPHMDDEILGCGGIIAKRKSEGGSVDVLIVTKPCTPIYTEEFIEQEIDECRNAMEVIGYDNLYHLGFPTTWLSEYNLNDILVKIQDIISKSQPQEIYIPHRGDIHEEHKLVSDVCMVACRPKNKKVKKIYAYEVLSETDWDIPNTTNAFIPNVYEDITDFLEKKIDALSKYESQIGHDYGARTIDAITALARHRGSIIGCKYAEAFMLIREIK